MMKPVRFIVVKIVILSGLLAMPAAAQPKNFWNVLAEVGFEKKKDVNGFWMEVPQFSQHLQSFNNKKIQLKGFVIPVGEAGSGKFMFSMLPFNVCYFCGAAGPETVVEVETTQKIEFSTQALVLEGTLQLNASNPDRHIYIFRSAVRVNK
jgi:hypothetical protein